MNPIKTYSFTDLRSIAKDQKYKLACLENSEGIRKKPFNNVKKSILVQLSEIQNRLKNDIFSDGIYYVCMASNINASRDPDRYAVKKGKANIEVVPKITLTPALNESPKEIENVLSYESALKYQQEISDLKFEIEKLKMLNLDLSKQLDEQESLEEEEESGKGILSGMSFLKEQLPALIPYLDKHFELQEKKLDLEKLKITKTNSKPINPQRIQIKIGSQEHLNLIENLYTSNNEERLNKELDKLQAFDSELYKNVCKQLQLEEEEEGGGQ